MQSHIDTHPDHDLSYCQDVKLQQPSKRSRSGPLGTPHNRSEQLDAARNPSEPLGAARRSSEPLGAAPSRCEEVVGWHMNQARLAGEAF